MVTKCVGERLTFAEALQVRAQILCSEGASYWLKGALDASANRDCVDAVCDAEVLAWVLDGLCVGVSSDRAYGCER